MEEMKIPMPKETNEWIPIKADLSLLETVKAAG